MPFLHAETNIGPLDCGRCARLPVRVMFNVGLLVPGFYRRRREPDKWQNIEVRTNRRASQDASLDLTHQCRERRAGHPLVSSRPGPHLTDSRAELRMRMRSTH
jgi:hypothetical protein